MAKYRISFIKCYSSVYKVAARCFLVATPGSDTPVNPSGTTFTDSGNNYNSSNEFEDGYEGTGQWHSESLTDCTVVYWGIVDFGTEDPTVTEIKWIAAIASVADRSPKEFSIEKYVGEAWVEILHVSDIPVWTASEVRRWEFNQHGEGTIQGTVESGGVGVAADVTLFHEASGEMMERVVSSAADGSYEFGAGDIDLFINIKYTIVADYGDQRPLAHGPNLAFFPLPAADPYWDDVVLLLPMEAADQSTVFDDVSDSNHTITTTGGAKHVLHARKFGETSMALNGDGDALAGPTSTDWAFGTGDFTIEFWVRLEADSDNGGRLIETKAYGVAGGLIIYLDNVTGDRQLQFVDTGGTKYLSSSIDELTLGPWHHVALSRASGTTYLFLNGIEEGSVADTLDYDEGTLAIGGVLTGGTNIKGYMDEIRITKGTGRYTGAFTPPTSPFPQEGP